MNRNMKRQIEDLQERERYFRQELAKSCAESSALRKKVTDYESSMNGACVEGQHCKACANAISYKETGVWFADNLVSMNFSVCCRLKVPCKQFDYKEDTKDEQNN